MSGDALFRGYPALAPGLPWTPLGRFPTPVEPLRAADGDAWVKRDDRAGLPYGGNKVRKLEFLLAEAAERGAERLITVGAAGSHHALATAVYGRSLGFRVTLVLCPQPFTPHVRDVLLAAVEAGATVRPVRSMARVPAGVIAARWAHRSERTFVVPAGGSDATGTIGYVGGALELAEQVQRGELPSPARVWVAAGSLGTAAGLAIGFRLAGLETRVQAVRVTSRLFANRWTLAWLVRRTLARLAEAGLDPLPTASEVLDRLRLLHGHIGRGYGHQTSEGRDVLDRWRAAGLALDPTYTAKAAAALAAAAAGDGTDLYWHTLSSSMPPGSAAAAIPPSVRPLLDACRRMS